MAKETIEDQIDAWRQYVRGRQVVSPADGDELEDHLRARIEELTDSGLAADEAFLVAVKRMGSLDSLTREFAREHSDRLWKQLVLDGSDREPGRQPTLLLALGWAAAAAVALKIPALLGLSLDQDAHFYVRYAPLFALVPVAGYLISARQSGRQTVAVVAALFLLGAVGAGVYPTDLGADVTLLTALHLPIALWLVVGIAYTDTDWSTGPPWMDFIRFTGEWVVYLALIALGGGVLTGLTGGALNAAGVDPEPFLTQWMVPCGVVGAMVVAAWLVEEKKSVIENMAPVLGKVFTPLFVATLAGLVVTILVRGIDVDRDALILFDLVLVVVLGLIVYGFSARDPASPAALFDWLQLALVAAALLVDLLVLVAISVRLSDYGFSANRTAALGENLVLLVNLSWSAWLLLGLVRGRSRFGALEQWQTRYVWVYATWAWGVVFLFPPIFGFHEAGAG